jgi:hypothetical protein
MFSQNAYRQVYLQDPEEIILLAMKAPWIEFLQSGVVLFNTISNLLEVSNTGGKIGVQSDCETRLHTDFPTYVSWIGTNVHFAIFSYILGEIISDHCRAYAYILLIYVQKCLRGAAVRLRLLPLLIDVFSRDLQPFALIHHALCAIFPFSCESVQSIEPCFTAQCTWQ